MRASIVLETTLAAGLLFATACTHAGNPEATEAVYAGDALGADLDRLFPPKEIVDAKGSTRTLVVRQLTSAIVDAYPKELCNLVWLAFAGDFSRAYECEGGRLRRTIAEQIAHWYRNDLLHLSFVVGFSEDERCDEAPDSPPLIVPRTLILVYRAPNPNLHASSFMSKLAVAPDFQGRGVGKWLLRGTLANAKERGLLYLEWNTAADRASAVRLYDAIANSSERSLQVVEPGGPKIEIIDYAAEIDEALVKIERAPEILGSE